MRSDFYSLLSYIEVAEKKSRMYIFIYDRVAQNHTPARWKNFCIDLYRPQFDHVFHGLLHAVPAVIKVGSNGNLKILPGTTETCSERGKEQNSPERNSMNHFFEPEAQMEVLWPDIPEIPAVDPVFRPRVFAPYESRNGGFSREEGNFQPNRRNSTRRMIELLRAMWSASVDRRERDCSQGYRHMIKERRRREEMRQRYLDLRSMLPPGTKSDNITVIQEAASHLINLQCLKEELQRRNQELEASLQKIKEPFPEGAANVEFEVVDPPSAVGLMIEVMKCLKSREMKVRAIRSTPTTGGMKVTVETVNETSASCSALTEVAKELAFDFVEAINAGAAEKYFSSGDDTWHGEIGSRHF